MATMNGTNGQSNGVGQWTPQGRILDHLGNPFISPEEQRRESTYGPFPVPHVIQFATLMGHAWKTYWTGRHDEAMRFGRQEAVFMRNELFLMGLLQERILGAASLKWRVAVDNARDPWQKAVKEGVTAIVNATPQRHSQNYYLRESVWYGRYGSQLIWKYDQMNLPLPGKSGQSAPAKAFKCVAHQPVNGDKIDFQWDGTPFILVSGTEGRGGPRTAVPGADTIITNIGGRGLRLHTKNWRQRFVIHKHLSLDADFFDYQAASAIHGVGIRSFLWWYHWLRLEWLSNIADWVQRTGLGVRLWYYQGGNKASRDAVAEAAGKQSDKTNILIPRFPVGGGTGQALEGVDYVDTASTGAELLLKLLTHLEEHMERYVIGQTLSSSTEGSGLGGTGVAAMHSDTKSKIIAFDAGLFDDCYSSDFIAPMVEYTSPWADFPVRYQTIVDEYDPKEAMDAVKTMVEFGTDVAEDAVRDITGLAAPLPGDRTVLQNMQEMQQKQQQDQMAQQAAMQPQQQQGQPGQEQQGQVEETEPGQGAGNGQADQTLGYSRVRQNETSRSGAPPGAPESVFQRESQDNSGESISGGVGDSRPDSDFDQESLAEGVKVEMEHTADPDVAKEIAKDHLTEDPGYYSKLRKVEQHSREIDLDIERKRLKKNESDIEPGESGSGVDCYAMICDEIERFERELPTVQT